MKVIPLENTNYIKSNDTGSEIVLRVYDYDGLELDLQSFEGVEVVIADDGGRVRQFTNPTLNGGGELQFSFTLEDLLPHGEYRIEVVLDEGTQYRVAPSEGYLQLNVEQSIDEVADGEIAVIVIQEFEQRIDAAEQSAYDAADYTNQVGQDVEDAEQVRESNEQSRQTAESTRESNEDTRQTNEQARQTTHTEMEELIADTRYIEEWASGSTYDTNNIVSYLGNSFISLQDGNTGNEPDINGDTAYWGLMAKSGEVLQSDLDALMDDAKITQPLSRGLSILTSERTTPLQFSKLEGRTTVNHVPLFDSGLWDFSESTIDSPSKVTVNASTKGTKGNLTISVKEGQTYTLSGKTSDSNALLAVRKENSNGTLLEATGGEVSTTFTVDSTFNGKAYVYLYANATETYTFENIMLNEGSTAQPFVANVKGITNPMVRSYGKNIFDAEIESGYYYTSTGNSAEEQNSIAGKNRIKVVPNQTYSITNSLNYDYSLINYYDEDDNYISRDQKVNQFTTPTNAKYIRISYYNNGTDTSNSIMLNLGSEATPFEPYNPSYQAIKSTFYSDDQLTWNENGYPVKFKKHEEVKLEGNEDWEFDSSLTDGKIVKMLSYFSSIESYNQSLVSADFRGRILPPLPSSSNWLGVNYIHNTSGGDFKVSLSNEDTGWGDSYTPTADEIKAYFMGWKMYNGDVDASEPYNGTGTKSWAKIYSGEGEKDSTGTVVKYSGTTTLPTVMNDKGYTPYLLVYELAEPETEQLSYEGSLELHEGQNQVELLEGVVVREKANPKQNSSNDVYYINIEDGYTSNVPDGAELSNQVKSVMDIYENGNLFTKYTTSNAGAYGNQRIEIQPEDFDPDATYEVTYIALPYELTTEIQNAEVEYAQNLNTALNQNIQRTTDNEHKISVLSHEKASKYQEGWIEPILLNGWVNSSNEDGNCAFMKNDFGFIHIKGIVKNGNMDSVLFILPSNYRPRKIVGTLVYARQSDLSKDYARLIIYPNGNVELRNGGNDLVYLDGISFRAEQ